MTGTWMAFPNQTNAPPLLLHQQCTEDQIKNVPNHQWPYQFFLTTTPSVAEFN